MSQKDLIFGLAMDSKQRALAGLDNLEREQHLSEIEEKKCHICTRATRNGDGTLAGCKQGLNRREAWADGWCEAFSDE